MTRPHPIRGALAAVRRFGFRQWFLLGLNTVLALAALACGLGLRSVCGGLITLTAADRFRGENELRFAQLACYLPVGQEKTVSDILQFRQTLTTAFTEQSLEAPEGGSLYLDAYCGSATLSIRSDHGSASVAALGVGGDYFYFHPLPLLGGSYISEDDVMDDLVVLDEETAWRLYGSADLAGMTVYLNDTPFVVSGVVARETDFASRRAYPGGGGIYLSWAALERLGGSAGIDCYEIVMPDPISNYAKNLLAERFPIGSGDVVENSGRFGLARLVGVIRSFGERSMRTGGVIYPYWENAARLTEDYAALLLVLAAVFALCPVLFLLAAMLRALRRLWRIIKVKVPERVEAAVERRREARLERAYNKKTGGVGHG